MFFLNELFETWIEWILGGAGVGGPKGTGSSG